MYITTHAHGNILTVHVLSLQFHKTTEAEPATAWFQVFHNIWDTHCFPCMCVCVHTWHRWSSDMMQQVTSQDHYTNSSPFWLTSVSVNQERNKARKYHVPGTDVEAIASCWLSCRGMAVFLNESVVALFSVSFTRSACHQIVH